MAALLHISIHPWKVLILHLTEANGQYSCGIIVLRHLDELRDIGSYLKMAVQHKNYKTSLEQRLKITKTLLQGEGKDF